jgi:hypothetical protein
MATPPMYRMWKHMRSRCNNPNNSRYADYGGRGIKVCERWSMFNNFIKDMGPKPEGKSLDRVDNSKGYSPENCRWSTIKEQANNKRNNRLFNIGGAIKTLAQWIDESEVKSSTIRQRFYGFKWDIEKSLSSPVRKRG